MPDTIQIPLSQGHVATIDAADYDRLFLVEFHDGLFWAGRVCDRQWYASVKKHTVYAVAKVAGLELRLHRLLLSARFGELVDHEDHNGLNCCRANLRRASASMNAQNRRPSGERSLPKGVGLHKKTGKYEAFIKQDRRKHHLGLFATPEEAAAKYNTEAVTRFGEFACLNQLEATP